jgi:hypothetical protein
LKLRIVLTAQQWQEMQHPQAWPGRPGGRRRGPASRATSTSTTNQK